MGNVGQDCILHAGFVTREPRRLEISEQAWKPAPLDLNLEMYYYSVN